MMLLPKGLNLHAQGWCRCPRLTHASAELVPSGDFSSFCPCSVLYGQSPFLGRGSGWKVRPWVWTHPCIGQARCPASPAPAVPLPLAHLLLLSPIGGLKVRPFSSQSRSCPRWRLFSRTSFTLFRRESWPQHVPLVTITRDEWDRAPSNLKEMTFRWLQMEGGAGHWSLNVCFSFHPDLCRA